MASASTSGSRAGMPASCATSTARPASGKILGSSFPEAKSVVVVLDNYYDGDPDPGPAPRLARYARGEDYHRVTRDRMEPLADFLRSEGATVAHTFADSGPVPERALALRAGLGWIGKNTMLIRPGAGSFFFIGTVFTDLSLEHDRSDATDHCGSCTRCLDACPTDALVEPRLLDATRCISYLTIEQKGPIPEPLAQRLEGWVFGCDICNEVCPWNQRFAEASSAEEFRSRDALAGRGPRGVRADGRRGVHPALRRHTARARRSPRNAAELPRGARAAGRPSPRRPAGDECADARRARVLRQAPALRRVGQRRDAEIASRRRGPAEGGALDGTHRRGGRALAGAAPGRAAGDRGLARLRPRRSAPPASSAWPRAGSATWSLSPGQTWRRASATGTVWESTGPARSGTS